MFLKGGGNIDAIEGAQTMILTGFESTLSRYTILTGRRWVIVLLGGMLARRCWGQLTGCTDQSP